MYEFFEGTIENIFAGYFSLNVNGIGFRIFAPNPYEFRSKEKVVVYVEQIIRDDEQSLYGFKTEKERNLFKKLLNVSGIGPKAALSILATGNQSGLIDAIQNGKVSYLTKFPGIGKKTAQQIVLDLRSKMSIFSNPNIQKKDNSKNYSTQLKEAVDALSALGFSKKETKNVANSLKKFGKMSTDKYIHKGLKILTK